MLHLHFGFAVPLPPVGILRVRIRAPRIYVLAIGAILIVCVMREAGER